MINKVEFELKNTIDGLKALVGDDFAAGRYELLTADEAHPSSDATLLLRMALRQVQWQLDNLGGVTSEAAGTLLGTLVLQIGLEDARRAAEKVVPVPDPEAVPVVRSIAKKRGG